MHIITFVRMASVIGVVEVAAAPAEGAGGADMLEMERRSGRRCWRRRVRERSI